MNAITKLAVEFIENHWQDIDLVKVELTKYSKQSLLKEVVEDYYLAGWVLMEVMSWGADKNYIDKYSIENRQDLLILLVDDKYFKFNPLTFLLEETKPKYKTIIYY